MPHTIGTQARSKNSLYTGFERELLIRKSGANSQRLFWSGKFSVLSMAPVLASGFSG